MQVKPLDASFGATVTGITLRELDDVGFQALYDTWLHYSLLVLPGQHLENAQQIAFAKRFGNLEIDIVELSNVKDDGSLRTASDDDRIKILKGNMGWHHDSTYMPVQAKGAVFRADVVPATGGETGWADMTAAYGALDEATRNRIETLSAHHSLIYSQGKSGFSHKKKGEESEYSGYGLDQEGAPLRPLVKTHPETGRKTLTIGRHAHAIPGLSEVESEALLDELVDFACRAPRIYHHSWTPGDVVVWDNRCLMHQARPWDMTEKRIMFHSRLAGHPKYEFAAPK
jgi:alpha-ketoglutarate-dependent taurine dioxygenase